MGYNPSGFSSHIIACSDTQVALSEVLNHFGKGCTVFPKSAEENDITMETAQEMLREAYLTSDEKRVFVVRSAVYRQEVQNKLLKTLEEPPLGVDFILICKSKTSLLPTVRSRLPIVHIKADKKTANFDAKLSRLDYRQMFELLKQLEAPGRDESLRQLESLFEQYAQLEPSISSQNLKEIEAFEKAVYLLSSNTRPGFVFSTILAQIASRRKA